MYSQRCSRFLKLYSNGFFAKSFFSDYKQNGISFCLLYFEDISLHINYRDYTRRIKLFFNRMYFNHIYYLTPLLDTIFWNNYQ